MAGVKISKLAPYNEVFDEEFFAEFINDMIVPVSLGNKTISVKIKELIHFINDQYESQDERLNEQEALILENKDLINQLTTAIVERIEELKNENDEEHQTILDKTDADKNELNEKIDTLKSENEAEHQVILDKTDSDKNELNEKIDTLSNENQEQHAEMQNIINENEQVTALSLIDLNQITEEILLRLHLFKENQEEIDKEQNEKIESITGSDNLWEIYND